jgi:ATP-binding cassette subfamily B multidrug efflux pump
MTTTTTGSGTAIGGFCVPTATPSCPDGPFPGRIIALYGFDMLIKLLKSNLLPYRKLLLAVLVLQVVQVSATMSLPTINANIIDKGILAGDTSYIVRMGGIMLGLALVQGVFAVWATYYGAKAATSFGRDIRNDLFHRVTSFSTREVDQFGSPSLITRITNDVQQVQMLVIMLCTMFVAAPITIGIGIFLAVREDGPLSLILLVAIPLLLLAVGLVIVRMVPQFQMMQLRIDRVNQVLREQIIGMRVVRAFVREPLETDRFGVANGDLTLTSLRAGRLMGLMFPAVMLILNVSSVAAVWMGGNRIGAGSLQVGALIAFLTYLVQILMAVMMATFVAVLWPRAAVCADRIEEVLSTETSVVLSPTPITELPGRGTLEFRDVGFSFPGADAPVLCNVSFIARPGQMTAIIGSTGSGKTTLVNLIPRLVDCTEGVVLVDGADVRTLDPEVLWRRVSLVPQKPYLFTGTVASNLRFADPDATDEELWHALDIAQAREFVAAMPGGLDAPISQGGTNVSGGQRQRLAIARALVRKPGIYVFDDSFSALDLATDARLRAALAPETADATVIVVAQRVSTIKNADQIIVLEDGETVGIGTHAELLVTCPTYAEIVSSQMTAEEAA